jgi:hypothetical protein
MLSEAKIQTAAMQAQTATMQETTQTVNCASHTQQPEATKPDAELLKKKFSIRAGATTVFAW